MVFQTKPHQRQDVGEMYSIGLFRITMWLSSCVKIVEGYSSGAPFTTCTSLQPGHGSPNGGVPPFTLEILNGVTTYTPGTPVTVLVSGSQFEGLFIQGRTSSGPTGTWNTPPTDSHTRTMTCSNTDDTITHLNTNLKTSVVLTWNPPLDDAGTVTFSGVVAEAQYSWWKDLQSGSLSYSVPGEGDMTTSERTAAESTLSPLDQATEEEITTQGNGSATSHHKYVEATKFLLAVVVNLLLTVDN